MPLLLICSDSSIAEVLSFGPSTNSSVFWIDQSRPNTNIPPSYQKWGFVFKVPVGFNQIKSLRVFVRSGGFPDDATEFQVKLTEWDVLNEQPIGDPIFLSSPHPFANDPSVPEAERGTSPTDFLVQKEVTPDTTYIIEILGDGLASMNTTTGFTDAGLYEWQEGYGWRMFGDHDLRIDIDILPPEIIMLDGFERSYVK